MRFAPHQWQFLLFKPLMYYSNMHVNFFFPFVRCLFGFKVIMSPVSICCVARALLFAGCSLLTGDAVLNIPATVWKVINIVNQTLLLKKGSYFVSFQQVIDPVKSHQLLPNAFTVKCAQTGTCLTEAHLTSHRGVVVRDKD